LDKLIYTALSGAKQVMDQQATVANNLANVSTAGFRAQIDSYQAVPIVGDGELNTRTQVVSEIPAVIIHTVRFRELDVI